jgi:hypothetical protein
MMAKIVVGVVSSHDVHVYPPLEGSAFNPGYAC